MPSTCSTEAPAGPGPRRLVLDTNVVLALARRKFRLHGLRIVSPKEAAAALAVNLSMPAP
jgi:hypothetical protein